MIISPEWASIGSWICVLVDECLDVCAGGELFEFVAAPDANTASMVGIVELDLCIGEQCLDVCAGGKHAVH